MKSLTIILVWVLSLTFFPGPGSPASEVDQLKADLIGQIMGGRDKGWKFLSPNQIKELVINDKKEEPQRRIYSVTLKLQDPRSPGVYKADAVVTYEKADSSWKVKGVGLKSMERVE